MKQNKITGIVGTIILHVVVLLLLLLLKLVAPEPQEEGGVPVMLGNTETAQGTDDPYSLTEVDVLPQPETSLPEPEVAPEPEVKQPMITQDDEPSIVVKKEKSKTEKKKTETKKPVKVEKPKQPVKPVEQPKEKLRLKNVPKLSGQRHRLLPIRLPELLAKDHRWAAKEMPVRALEYRVARTEMLRKERPAESEDTELST